MISVIVISKDEPALGETLRRVSEQMQLLEEESELIVVDASKGRLADIQRSFRDVRWIDYAPPLGVRISIPHQRNRGVREARGEVLVFTDAGCLPRPGWLAKLVNSVRASGEAVAAGLTVAPEGAGSYYELGVQKAMAREYLDEAPTINLAFTRAAFDRVDGFDESFQYGSDLDFTWRLIDAGFRIRHLPDAVVEHDWGPARRQFRRAYLYGQAKVRLYRKHRGRLRGVWRQDPVVVVYPLFILLLPLTRLFPAYPVLLAIPAWRARRTYPMMTVADHLVYGCGVLVELGRTALRRLTAP